MASPYFERLSGSSYRPDVMSAVPSAEERLYPPTLERQVGQFIGNLEAYNEQKPEFARRDPRNYAFLEHFFKELFTERNARTYEVESAEYQQVAELANSQFPTPLYLNLCIDGRVLPVLVMGASANIGASTRVPGGMHKEFIRGQNGKMMLRKNSTFAKIVTSALDSSPNGVITENYDSHLACAARAQEETRAGRHPNDSGLYADVLHKKEMAEATVRYVEETFGDTKKVIPIQTSFDPNTGFLYMGLETNTALHYIEGYAQGVNTKPEFTQDALDFLTNQGVIISTKQLSEIPQITSVFEQYATFPMDWQHNYVDTARSFWQAIASMREQLLPLIEKQVTDTFPHLSDDNPLAVQERQERAMLLLANAFSGYMNNFYSETDGEQEYRYGVHREQFVKVYEGGYAPYDISAFVVWSLDINNLPDNIELASDLVRANRRASRIVDSSDIFTNPEEFEQAVVPVVLQEIVRDNISEQEWQKYSEIDWSDLQQQPWQWDTVDDTTFNNYILRKGIQNALLMIGINNLRRRMAILYDPNIPIATHLVEQYKIALPVISGPTRRSYFVLPFVKYGFDNQS